MDFKTPNAQCSAAGHGRPIPILPEFPEARLAIRAKRLGGRLQHMVGRRFFLIYSIGKHISL
jgi:hypothetical protein